MLGLRRTSSSGGSGREPGLLRRTARAVGWAVLATVAASVPFPVVAQLVWLLVWLLVPALWTTAAGLLAHAGWRRAGRPGRALLTRAARTARGWPALILRRRRRLTATDPSTSNPRPALELVDVERSTR